MSTNTQDELHYAAKQFFERGFALATITDIVRDSRAAGVAISESTLLRRYRSKAGLFAAVIELAARSIRAKVLARIERDHLTLDGSDPRDLALLYMTTVLEMWESSSPERWHVGLAFGHDGLSSGEIERSSWELFSDGAMADIHLLDSILIRGCGGEIRIAMSVSCLLIGCIEEFVFAAIVKCPAYTRSYDAPGVLAIVRLLLDATLLRRGVPRDSPDSGVQSLSDVAAKLREQAAVLDRLRHR